MPKPLSADPLSDLAACRAILRDGSKSFHAASRLLPARVRAPATALYAFCRVADDAIDESRAPDRLARLADRLDRAYQGRPYADPVDRAFAAVAASHRIPRAIPDALLEGFAWDAENRRCADLCDLEAYAVRVAGTVGLMMALIMGVRRGPALARALDLGVAMQLTNIARDVGCDARMGRLYLPLDWLAEAGVDADALLARPVHTPALGAVVRRLLDVADLYYGRADRGVAQLPLDCRPAIAAARSIYSGIGAEVARAGFDSVSRRAVLGRSAKLGRLLAASASVMTPPPLGVGPEPVSAGRPLLAAVAAIAAPSSAPVESRPRPTFDDRVGGLVDIFARLEQRSLRAGSASAEGRMA